jgi:hypothetical protein
MIPISMRGFAEVSSAPPAAKQKVLKKYKNSKSGESKGRSNYYVAAISTIKRYHRSDDKQIILSKIAELETLADSEANTRARSKLRSNARALKSYLQYFGNRSLTIRPGKRLYYYHRDLAISAQPDIVAEEAGKLVLIKLNASGKSHDGGMVALLLHALHEAAILQHLPVSARGVEYLDLPSGQRICGPVDGFGSTAVLQNNCEALISLWNEAA